jgi:hypothetical protein
VSCAPCVQEIEAHEVENAAMRAQSQHAKHSGEMTERNRKQVMEVCSCCSAGCRVVSCRVVSCRVVSCRVVSCRVVSCRVVSCLVWCWRHNAVLVAGPRG